MASSPALQPARISIATGAPLCRNPRVLKEADALSEAGYDVTVLRPVLRDDWHRLDREIEASVAWSVRTTANLTGSRLGGALQRVRRRVGVTAVHLFDRQSESALGYGVSKTASLAHRMRADLTIGHQEVGLIVAERLARAGHRTGVDIEDWYSEDLPPESRVGRPVRLLRRAEEAAVRRGGAVWTTSNALASTLAQRSGGKTPETIYNVFRWSDRTQIDGRRLDRDPSDPRPSLHWVSQTIGAGRGLETLFEALARVEIPVNVHLRGDVDEETESRLRKLFPQQHGHSLWMHPPVPPSELLSRIAEHDIGLALEPIYPPNKNLTISNKLFHYLLGGLAVVATETRGQAEVAAEAPGAVHLCQSEDATSLASVLSRLVGDPEALRAARAQALRAAQDRFCWERQAPVLVATVGRALGL